MSSISIGLEELALFEFVMRMSQICRDLSVCAENRVQSSHKRPLAYGVKTAELILCIHSFV